jgi:hypothetical protein
MAGNGQSVWQKLTQFSSPDSDQRAASLVMPLDFTLSVEFSRIF